MKNINLLPKIPTAKRVFYPVLLSSTAVCAIVLTGMLYAGFYFKEQVGLTEDKIRLENASKLSLLAKRRLDEQTQNYQALQTEVARLKNMRTDWSPIFDALTAYLPDSARIVSAEYGKKSDNQNQQAAEQQAETLKSVTLTLEFAAIRSIAEYATLLQSSPLVQSVAVQSAVKAEKTLPKQQETAATNPTPATAAPSDEETLRKQLTGGMKKADTEGEELLNQLQWIFNQKLVEDEYGITLPDSDFTTGLDDSDALNDEYAPLTPGDFEAARKKLDDLKKQTQTEKAPGTTPGVDIPEQKYTVYDVKLQIMLKNPVQEK